MSSLYEILATYVISLSCIHLFLLDLSSLICMQTFFAYNVSFPISNDQNEWLVIYISVAIARRRP